ncbi:MAG: bifunctional (p)ppGpp synthetase/guanosine-3',5'-bis(diphosphate) 3'-pyrophosphohydrolase, partial [Candidatus Omnitrophica bacterium]|nr:bifunctional (p)ppGpp synthetase/guanosine-3',5'-bis(diphosphate) 3'-pyrophosphohydrolase [Candidatus Omnitrophota bacterium]
MQVSLHSLSEEIDRIDPALVAELEDKESSQSPDLHQSLIERMDKILEGFPEEPDPVLRSLPYRALDFAFKAHGDQYRSSGKPYITHPVAVAELVGELVPDRPTLAAALLHDVVEDTEISSANITELFGQEVAFLVDGVTKVSQIRYALSHEKQIENLRRLLVATAKDLRVILIKLCDRLHNMRTLTPLAPAKRRQICQSTLDIFAPLAHRLGVEKIKNELQDLCLFYLNPGIYRRIKEQVAERLVERREYAEKVRHNIADVLATHGIEGNVEWRVKHFWSIYQKMERDRKDFSEIYDLTGIRILVESVDECYGALGIVHAVWPPVEGRFKDYISNPKPNDYRSIHTTLLGPEGRLLEVQIRTFQMHRVCEEGVAAHWRYKDLGRSSRRLGDDAAWIQQLSGILNEEMGAEEWTESLKTELFTSETYCYTPRGDIIRLPVGSCPIDFAYQIHTDLGDRCQGARVNGRFVPLSHRLKTGDLVEIVTSKSAHPTPDWLNLVKSSRARQKIRNSLLDLNRDTLIEQGRVLLGRELHRIGKDPAKFVQTKLCGRIIEQLKVKDLDDLFALIGFGRIATKQVLARIIQSEAKSKSTRKETQGETIKVSEIDDVLYRLARCCHPVKGEPIIGLVTRNRGISIHRETCVNITKFQGDPARLIPLNWEGSAEKVSKVDIVVEASDRTQLLADVTNTISSVG